MGPCLSDWWRIQFNVSVEGMESKTGRIWIDPTRSRDRLGSPLLEFRRLVEWFENRKPEPYTVSGVMVSLGVVSLSPSRLAYAAEPMGGPQASEPQLSLT